MGDKDIFDIEQNFARPLQIVIRQNMGGGKYKDTELTADKLQHVELATIKPVDNDEVEEMKTYTLADAVAEQTADRWGTMTGVGNDFDQLNDGKRRMVNMDAAFNSEVSDIFKNQYLTPRSPYTTLCVPTQGMGDWCSTKKLAKIDDSKLRSMVKDGSFETLPGLSFRTPAEGKNIAYTSLWDNYPDSITIPLSGKASHAYLLMAGSTNPMQFAIENAVVRVEYTDGTTDELMLVPPVNWCPIEQDFVENAVAFAMPAVRPYRIGLNTGIVSRHLFRDSHYQETATAGDLPDMKLAMCALPGGAATMLDMPLNAKKKLRSLTLRALSNEVVVGLMGVTLQK